MTSPTRPWQDVKLPAHPLSTQTVSASLPSSISGRILDSAFPVLNSDYVLRLDTPQYLGATSLANLFSLRSCLSMPTLFAFYRSINRSNLVQQNGRGLASQQFLDLLQHAAYVPFFSCSLSFQRFAPILLWISVTSTASFQICLPVTL